MSATREKEETMELAAMTPAEVDALLFEALAPAHQAENQIYRLKAKARNYRKYGSSYARNVEHYEAEAAKLTATLPELYAPSEPYQAEFERRGGWARYVVVAGGHLHYRSCHTLVPGRTMVGLVVEASGLDESEVVGKYGTTACTHCFPTAPVAPKLTPAEEGFCERSGTGLTEEEWDRLPPGWQSRYGSPSLKCQCGGRPAITKNGRVRKHKPGTPK